MLRFQLFTMMQALIHLLVAILPAIRLFTSRSLSQKLQQSMIEFQNWVSAVPFLATAAWRVKSPIPRPCWTYPGMGHWFHTVMLKLWDENLWIENFRMPKQTLFKVADVLRPYIMMKDTVMHSAVPVEE